MLPTPSQEAFRNSPYIHGRKPFTFLSCVSGGATSREIIGDPPEGKILTTRGHPRTQPPPGTADGWRDLDVPSLYVKLSNLDRDSLEPDPGTFLFEEAAPWSDLGETNPNMQKLCRGGPQWVLGPGSTGAVLTTPRLLATSLDELLSARRYRTPRSHEPAARRQSDRWRF